MTEVMNGNRRRGVLACNALATVRLDERTATELNALAAALGLCRSRLIREIIERELRRVAASVAA
jgi:predicted DNA-binding protein